MEMRPNDANPGEKKISRDASAPGDRGGPRRLRVARRGGLTERRAVRRATARDAVHDMQRVMKRTSRRGDGPSSSRRRDLAGVRFGQAVFAPILYGIARPARERYE
jgi:hypothetical protein